MVIPEIKPSGKLNCESEQLILFINKKKYVFYFNEDGNLPNELAHNKS
jgi:hypothetical protein